MYLTLKNSGLYIYTLSIFKIFKTVHKITEKYYKFYLTEKCIVYTLLRLLLSSALLEFDFINGILGLKAFFLEKSIVIIILLL